MGGREYCLPRSVERVIRDEGDLRERREGQREKRVEEAASLLQASVAVENVEPTPPHLVGNDSERGAIWVGGRRYGLRHQRLLGEHGRGVYPQVQNI